MPWNETQNKEIEIPINIDLLITDGQDVFVGFYDSNLEWRLIDQTVCDEINFMVFYWMEFPLPP